MILVFRKYHDNGTPDNSERPIEREAFTQEDAQSFIQELQAVGYELECIQ